MGDQPTELKRENWNVVKNFNPRRPWSVVWVSSNGIPSIDRSCPDDVNFFSSRDDADREASRRIADGLAGSSP